MEHFRIENLSFSYPTSKDKKSLDNVSLKIEKGEYIVLCGKSGSGKTTLLRHLKTVLTPHGKRTGEIYFNSTPLKDTDNRTQSAKIGYVMQNPDDQIVTDKVWHELAFGLESLGCDQKTMRSRVAEMACYFGIQDWFHRDVAVLSGGQKQLLNLASIMAMQPEVLILDEPTSQLDPIAASDFLNTVRKINTELGTTVIITEHRLEDIFPYADRAIVMDSGKIIADDTPRNIGKLLFEQNNPMFTAMPTPVRVFYNTNGNGDCPLTVREGRSWLSNEFETEPQIKEFPCKNIDDEIDNHALSLKELWFRYEKDTPDILRGVSLEIPSGSISAIVGGNGAGKSTTLKAICGICKPYRGKIKVFGKPVSKFRSGELFRNCISMLPQDPKSLFAKNNVLDELSEMTKDRNMINGVAETCRITELLNNHPYDLSGGEQQRVALAKVLLTEPKILLLDEPTKGMDSFFKETFADILNKLKEQGITILMVSHDVEFCAKYADRVSMFFDGQVLATETSQKFFGGNSFYTTAANRMSKHIFKNAVTAENVVELYKKNKGGTQ
ncbi:MAG: energy-coupling factor transporter ATPase [Acutalibacteraceae bacterium]|nr:energy-coupling factor transporter ATPase [Acutalibacteraceae bacterium]